MPACRKRCRERLRPALRWPARRSSAASGQPGQRPRRRCGRRPARPRSSGRGTAQRWRGCFGRWSRWNREWRVASMPLPNASVPLSPTSHCGCSDVDGLHSSPSERLANHLSVPQHRSGQQQGIDAVEHAAVARQQASGILDAGRALERRLGQDRPPARPHSPPRPSPASTTRPHRKESLVKFHWASSIESQYSPPVTSTLPTTEPIAPAQVLLGLIAGASLRVPHMRPT